MPCMALLRHRDLRRVLTALFILNALLVPLQTYFDCELLGAGLQRTCCCDSVQMAHGCEHGGGCNEEGGGSMAGCCSVTVERADTDGIASAQQAVPLIALPQAHPPPPAAVYGFATRDLAVPAVYPMPSFRETGHPDSGTSIYLLTRRFRI